MKELLFSIKSTKELLFVGCLCSKSVKKYMNRPVSAKSPSASSIGADFSSGMCHKFMLHRQACCVYICMRNQPDLWSSERHEEGRVKGELTSSAVSRKQQSAQSGRCNWNVLQEHFWIKSFKFSGCKFFFQTGALTVQCQSHILRPKIHNNIKIHIKYRCLNPQSNPKSCQEPEATQQLQTITLPALC